MKLLRLISFVSDPPTIEQRFLLGQVEPWEIGDIPQETKMMALCMIATLLNRSHRRRFGTYLAIASNFPTAPFRVFKWTVLKIRRFRKHPLISHFSEPYQVAIAACEVLHASEWLLKCVPHYLGIPERDGIGGYKLGEFFNAYISRDAVYWYHTEQNDGDESTLTRFWELGFRPATAHWQTILSRLPVIPNNNSRVRRFCHLADLIVKKRGEHTEQSSRSTIFFIMTRIQLLKRCSLSEQMAKLGISKGLWPMTTAEQIIHLATPMDCQVAFVNWRIKYRHGDGDLNLLEKIIDRLPDRTVDSQLYNDLNSEGWNHNFMFMIPWLLSKGIPLDKFSRYASFVRTLSGIKILCEHGWCPDSESMRRFPTLGYGYYNYYPAAARRASAVIARHSFHILYRPGGSGYNRCKQDFEALAGSNL
jgi:hypothetical protein